VSSLKCHWAEILVARRVEQVEGEPLVLEAYHRRGDRDATLALDHHPIRAHPPPLAARLHFPRHLDRPAEQQQFLGQGGLAGNRIANCYYADLSPNQPADKQADEAADQDANQNKSKCMLLRPRDAVFFQDMR
jgi:hypothetical protein